MLDGYGSGQLSIKMSCRRVKASNESAEQQQKYAGTRMNLSGRLRNIWKKHYIIGDMWPYSAWLYCGVRRCRCRRRRRRRRRRRL